MSLTIGTIKLKNGKTKARLEFGNGRTVKLKPEEWSELEYKINDLIYNAKYTYNKQTI